MHTGFAQKETSQDVHRVQAILLAESGITRAEYFLNGGDGHDMYWETEKYDETVEDYGKILLNAKRFGLFTRIESKGIRVNTTCTLNGLFGRNIPDILKPSLTLTGHVGGLILHEGSTVDSYIVLHHGDIYNERRGRPLAEYQKRLIIRESPGLPFDSLLIPELMSKLNSTHILLLSNSNSLTGNITINSTDEKLLKNDTIVVLGNCQIENTSLSDKVLIVSGTITINRGVLIQGSQFYAEQVIVDGGSIGSSLLFSSKKMKINDGIINSQLYCKDSVTWKKGVKSGKMTVVACIRVTNKDTVLTGGIYLESNTVFRGTLISFMDRSVKNIVAGPSIVFGKGCSVLGCVITNHDLDFHETEIKGSVWARTIMTQYEGKSFTNYLIKSEIKRPDEEIIFPLIGSLPAKITGEIPN